MATGGSYFFIRPRRFGKMLLINSLKTIAEGPQYKSYFSKTRICKEDMKDDDGNFLSNEGLITNIPEKYNWPKYPVMHFDFRPLSSRSSLVDTLSELWEQLLNIVEKYGLESTNMKVQKAIEYVNNESYLYQEPIPTDLETKITKKSDACLKLMELIMKAMVTLGNGYKEEIVILIDEFDSIYQSKFAIRYQQAEQDRKAEKYVSPFTEFMQNFYGKFKDNNTLIHLKFITGVTMLHIDKLYSPLLDTSNISTFPSYASLVGYTDDDIRTLFSDSLFIDLYEGGCGNISITTQLSYTKEQMKPIKDTIMKKLTSWYNGYKFANTDIKIFNPMSVNLAFDSGLFEKFWCFNTSNNFKREILRKNMAFFKSLETDEEVAGVEHRILVGTRSECGDEREKCIALLYQTGLLTIKKREEVSGKGSIYTLHFPNKEIKENYNSTVESLMKNELEHDYFGLATKIHRTFMDDNWEDFVVVIYKAFGLNLHGSRSKKTESHYRDIFHAFMLMVGIIIKPEEPTNENKLMDGIYRTKTIDYIFEYKQGKYLFGPKTKFNGIEQAYYRYCPYLDRETNKRMILIGINFLTKLENETITPISSDKNDDKYLTFEDRRNVCNIGQFIVMELNPDGSQQYIKEITPNGTECPVINNIPINNNDWDTNAKLYAEEHQTKQEVKTLKKTKLQPKLETPKKSKDIDKEDETEDKKNVKSLGKAGTSKKKKQPQIQNLKKSKK